MSVLLTSGSAVPSILKTFPLFITIQLSSGIAIDPHFVDQRIDVLFKWLEVDL